MKRLSKKKKSFMERLTRRRSTHHSQPITAEEFETMLAKLQTSEVRASDEESEYSNESANSARSLDNNIRLKLAHQLLVKRLVEEDNYLSVTDPQRTDIEADKKEDIEFKTSVVTWKENDVGDNVKKDTINGKGKTGVWFLPGPFFCCLIFHLLL